MAKRAKAGGSAPTSSADVGSTSSLLASAVNRTMQPPPSRPLGSPALGGAGGGLAARRAGGAPTLGAGGLNRPGGLGAGGLGSSTLGGGAAGRMKRPGAPGMTLSSMGGGLGPTGGMSGGGFSNFSKIIDPSGKLNFDKKAILHADGVDFSSGQKYEINKQDLELGDVLGKGNYGEVRIAYHKTTKVTMAMKVRLHLTLTVQSTR